MRIKSIHLRNYKRFTDLLITEIPQSARLVVLVGPNGSGKSSVFDAFLLKAYSTIANASLRTGLYEGYLLKDDTLDTNIQYTNQLAALVEIETDTEVKEWSKVFSIRSPYRHEADFSNTSLGPVRPAYESRRFQRIIDQDQAVSDNFNRLGRNALERALNSESGSKSLDQFRQDTLGKIQQAMAYLFEDPVLSLQDLGSGIDSGTFRFKKGTDHDFHFKNLSGGEKAAFDLLLDIFVKRNEFPNAIYCIDEPESHVASAIHGRLLETILRLIPGRSQLWIATHSTGFVRKGVELNRQRNDVVFVDFSNQDFDETVVLEPTRPNRNFFRKMYDVLQYDLAGLVAPDRIVLCEGGDTTDAKIYNRIFEETHPGTLFVARGGASAVEKGEVIPLLEAIVPSARVLRLIDRDDMPTEYRDEYIAQGIRVLGRREIENYLWDKAVVHKALVNIGTEDAAIESILEQYPFPNPKEDDVKKGHRQQQFFELIRWADGASFPGRTRKEFAYAHLAKALRETADVYQELRDDIFDTDS